MVGRRNLKDTFESYFYFWVIYPRFFNLDDCTFIISELTLSNPLICRANQWTGFYKTTASVLKELKYKPHLSLKLKLFHLNNCGESTLLKT